MPKTCPAKSQTTRASSQDRIMSRFANPEKPEYHGFYDGTDPDKWRPRPRRLTLRSSQSVSAAFVLRTWESMGTSKLIDARAASRSEVPERRPPGLWFGDFRSAGTRSERIRTRRCPRSKSQGRWKQPITQVSTARVRPVAPRSAFR